MKGVRAVAGGILILAAICAVPAVSAAQDGGSPGETTTTTADPPAPPPPAPPAAPDPAPPSSEPAGNTSKPGGSGGSADAAAPPPTNSVGPAGGDGSQRKGKAHTASSVTVRMGDFFFSPSSVSVRVGDIVTWHNSGNAPHTATADDGSFDTGTVVSGQSASHMFTRPGTFSYVCTIHPNMKGTVRVLSSSGSASSSGSGSSSSSAPTEAKAAASPNAAGDSNTLPMTGMAVGALALVGAALLVSGLIVRHSSRKAAAAAIGRQLTLF